MRVKICGITTLDDALLSVQLGAFALGFNFYPKSSRYISPSRAVSIIKQLPDTVRTVGVFVNESQEHIEKIKKETGIQMVQLHGDENHVFCRQLHGDIIKNIRLRNTCDLQQLDYFNGLYALLIDAFHSQYYGGTGKPANWELAKQVARKYPLILAGGLNPQNIAVAIHTVEPFAVDVCSGVEESPGHKSKEKLAHFFAEIKRGQ